MKKYEGRITIGEDTYGWNFKRFGRSGDGRALGHVLRVWLESSHGKDLLLELPFGMLGFFAVVDHGQVVEVLREWIPRASELGWNPATRGKPFRVLAKRKR